MKMEELRLQRPARVGVEILGDRNSILVFTTYFQPLGIGLVIASRMVSDGDHKADELEERLGAEDRMAGE